MSYCVVRRAALAYGAAANMKLSVLRSVMCCALCGPDWNGIVAQRRRYRAVSGRRLRGSLSPADEYRHDPAARTETAGVGGPRLGHHRRHLPGLGEVSDRFDQVPVRPGAGGAAVVLKTGSVTLTSMAAGKARQGPATGGSGWAMAAWTGRSPSITAAICSSRQVMSDLPCSVSW